MYFSKLNHFFCQGRVKSASLVLREFPVLRVIWCFHCFRCGEIFVGVCWLVLCSFLLLRFSLCFVAFDRGCGVSVNY